MKEKETSNLKYINKSLNILSNLDKDEWYYSDGIGVFKLTMYQDLPYMDAIGMYVKKYDDKIHGYKIVVSPDAVLELDIIGPLNEDELMVYLL